MKESLKSEYILSLNEIYRTYKLYRTEIKVLRGVNLDVKRGEWLALLGASGSGKTTLLNLIACLEKPDKGLIKYNGSEMAGLSRYAKTKFRRTKVGYVFQAYHLLPELNVLENVKLAAMLNGKISRSATSLAKGLLDQVGLGHRLKHRPGELSGGEQQRAAIARALVNDPELILADEPTGNLDSKTGAEIIELFEELHRDQAKTLIMVTHNDEIAGSADRVAVIKDGMILWN